MSVPSAKSSVMSVSAYFVIERSIVWFGMPKSSISMGAVIRAGRDQDQEALREREP
jgi:hypothetical protein